MQGVGNDFILVETNDIKRDWSRVAATMCDRHFGVGADGLLLLLPSDVADFGIRIFNADGSESEACGNGLRCLVKYAVARGLTNTETEGISVETIAGVRRARLYQEGDEVTKIQVGMGKPKFDAGDIPVTIEPGKGDSVDIITDYPVVVAGRKLSLSFVSMGNPHAIYFGERPVSDFPLSQLGPAVEKHRLFPNRVNFDVARVISRKRIEVRVWERGVGETLACGSGACAVAVVAQLLGYVDNKVDIELPGGILEVEWDRLGEVLLSGPAEIVFNGEWPDEG